jgi:peptidoglycan/LPS O-acetylase OafA/YrhL
MAGKTESHLTELRGKIANGAETSARGPGRAKALGYQPAFDGLRAVAITAVLFFHIYRWPRGGWLGVDLFFVLSGFLITTLLLEEWARHGSLSLRLFYVRRVLRLFPALWALLLISVPVFLVRERDISDVFESALYGITYTTNIAYALRLEIHRYEHLWSLAVEEQFYIMWPIMLALALRMGMRFRVVFAVIIASISTLAIARYAVASHSILAPARFRFDSILIGCAIGIASSIWGRDPLRRIARMPLLLAGAMAVIVSFFVFARVPHIPYGATLIFCVASGVMLVAALDDGVGPAAGRAQKLLTNRPIVFIGRISYALYLWHWVILRWVISGHPGGIAGAALRSTALLASVAAAAASYFLVEKPFLRRKWRLARTETHDTAVDDTAVVMTGRTHDARTDPPRKVELGS